MKEIFNVDKLPERRLSVRKMIQLERHMDIADAVQIAQRDMAVQLAAKILEGAPFFWSKSDQVAQFLSLEYGADCIVLTTEEYLAMKREAFMSGASTQCPIW